MITPYLPLFASDYGARGWQIGIIIGIFVFFALIFRIPAGQWADRRGGKIPFVLGSLSFFAVPLVFVYIHNPYYLMILRAIHGIGFGAISVCGMTLVLDITPQEKKGESIGYYTGALVTGAILGPSLGGILFGIYNYTGLFLAATATGLLGFCASFFLKEEKKERRPKAGSPKHIWKNANFQSAALGMFIVGLAWGIIVTFLPLLLKSMQFSERFVGLFFSICALSNMIARPTMGRLSDRINSLILIFPSLILIMIVTYYIAVAASTTEFIIIATLLGFSMGTGINVLFIMAMETTPIMFKGLVLALAAAGIDFGIGIGSMGGGALTGNVSLTEIYKITAWVMIVGILVFCIVLFQSKIFRTREQVSKNE